MRPRPVKPPVPAAIRATAGQYVDQAGKDWVYAYWDRDGELLYIGVSNNAAHRASRHRGESRWWRFVATGAVWLFDLSASGEAEIEMIEIFDPVFNIKHSLGSSKYVVEYCARYEAWDLVDYYLDAFGFDEAAAA